MSTIASPRDPSTPIPRRMNSSQAGATGNTPTSSSRPSFENPRSATGSPNLGAASFPPSSTLPGKRNNRAALREYYNLKKLAPSGSGAGGGGQPGSGAATPTLEVTDADALDGFMSGGGGSLFSESIPGSEMDAADFDAAAWVQGALTGKGLAELLGAYARVLGEIRALDAEKKALVYDNYSKLISATETIRKMRANMDPLNPMAATLDPAIAQIYAQASSIRDALRQSVRPPDEARATEEASSRRRRTRQLALEVLEMPKRIRRLVAEGKTEEARKAWELPRRLLETWKKKGLGGEDVAACLEEGDAALRGEEDTLEREDSLED